MHIGFLTPEYPHPRTLPSAGIGSSIFNLTRGLAEKGHSVSIFLYGQREDEIIEDKKGITIHLISNKKNSFLNWYLNRKSLQKYINRAINKEKIEILEAADWTGITAYMNFKCPLVIRMHGTDAYFCHLEDRKQKFKNYWLERKALRTADHLLSVSKFTAVETKRIFHLKKFVTVIPNTIDTEKFEPVVVNEENCCTILYFGSLIRKKGILELIKMFNLLIFENSEVQIRLVGPDTTDIFTGRSTKDLILETASEAAVKRITIAGSLPYERIKEEIAQATIVTLPSFAEAFPMTWLEAMAMEKALVTSNIGWAKEIMINQKTGFTVDPKDHNLFKHKVLSLLKDSTLRNTMGKAARRHVLQNFSPEIIVEKNLDFYKKVIQGET